MGSLDGSFVEIHGVEGTVEARDCCLNLVGEAVDPNGRRGRAAWDAGAARYAVATLDGVVLVVPEERLRACQHPEPEDGGADLSWPSGPAPRTRAAFALRAAQVLEARGYCVIQMPDAGARRREGTMRGEDAAYTLPMQEFEGAYLGTAHSSKVAWADDGSSLDAPAQEALAHYSDAVASLSSGLLSPEASEALGFRPWARRSGGGPALLRRPLAGEQERQRLTQPPVSRDDVEDGVVERHLDFIQRRRLCMMYVIDTAGGDLELHAREGFDWLEKETVKLPIMRDRLLLFRNDWMGHSLSCSEPERDSDLILQSWLLEEPTTMRIDSFEGGQAGMESIVGGPRLAPERQVHVMGGFCRFPGNVGGLAQDWMAYSMQTDAFRKITRWDHDLYYAEDSDQFSSQGKSVTRHAAHLDDEVLAAFDNRMFSITDDEAMVLAPMQRVLLETTFEGLHEVGYTLESLRGAPLFAAVADIGTEWDTWWGLKEAPDAWLKHGSLNATSCNRLCHILELTGPSIQVDTACSSSSVAANLLHAALRSHEHKGTTAGFMTSLMANMQPWPFIGLSSAGMLGSVGRCATFNSSANGFNRGEGAGGVVLEVSGGVRTTTDRLACYAASYVNQDGRSASLTAPNGPSQQAVMRSSLKAGEILPDDSVACELHGTGTALGDPIECGSVRAVFKAVSTNLHIGSGKTHMGHLESGAGAIGMLKMICSLAHAAFPANNHLRTLNAHIEVAGFPVAINNEISDIASEYHYGGCNSFGFGGTNSRCDLWCRRLHRVLDTPCLTSGGDPVLLRATPRAAQVPWVSKLDYLAVICSKCLRPMCWLCAEAIPADRGLGKHRCSRVRPETESYGHCSDCYAGAYQCGAPRGISSAGISIPLDEVYLAGTYNAWTERTPMRSTCVGSELVVFEAEITLGDTRLERFHVVWHTEGGDEVLHPVAKNAGQKVRVLGPCADNQGKDWLIDGRRDKVPEGTVYEIRFEWGIFAKSISWRPTERRTPPEEMFHHHYSSVDSLSRWLSSVGGNPEPGVWTWEVGKPGLPPPAIPSSGLMEFFILRDGDPKQAIYPMLPRPRDTSVPVMGPDDAGDGKRFVAWGQPGEQLKTRLTFRDDVMEISVSTFTMGWMSWTSTLGPGYQYYAVGSWSKWACEEMESDPEDPDIHRFQFVIGDDGREDFQIVANQNFGLRIYPASNRDAPGEGIVYGPDKKGKDKNFRVCGAPGQRMEVTLDTGAEDYCGRVLCSPLDADYELAG